MEESAAPFLEFELADGEDDYEWNEGFTVKVPVSCCAVCLSKLYLIIIAGCQLFMFSLSCGHAEQVWLWLVTSKKEHQMPGWMIHFATFLVAAVLLINILSLERNFERSARNFKARKGQPVIGCCLWWLTSWRAPFAHMFALGHVAATVFLACLKMQYTFDEYHFTSEDSSLEWHDLASRFALFTAFAYGPIGAPIWLLMMSCTNGTRRHIAKWIRRCKEEITDKNEQTPPKAATMKILMTEYRVMQAQVRNQWKSRGMTMPWLSAMIGSFVLMMVVMVLEVTPGNWLRKSIQIVLLIVAIFSFAFPLYELASVTQQLGAFKKKLERVSTKHFDHESVTCHQALLDLFRNEPVHVVLAQNWKLISVEVDYEFIKRTLMTYFIKLPSAFSFLNYVHSVWARGAS